MFILLIATYKYNNEKVSSFTNKHEFFKTREEAESRLDAYTSDIYAPINIVYDDNFTEVIFYDSYKADRKITQRMYLQINEVSVDEE